jgi:NitT/TauT family transport system ATP-binding protein
MSVLDVRNLTVGIDGKTVITDISFSIAERETVVLVGPSGCGKTTLLRSVLGFQEYAGTIIPAPERRQHAVGYIDQKANLLPWRTLRQNATLALELSHRLDKNWLAGVDALIDQYGLWPDRDKISAALSGGMAQRVAVIRALATKPTLLLCDEPFSAIDFVTRLELNSLFRSNCRVRGISTLFVTHNIEEAIFIADRILILGGNPTHIVGEEDVRDLGGSREDPIAVRQSPKFDKLFGVLWEHLTYARTA